VQYDGLKSGVTPTYKILQIMLTFFYTSNTCFSTNISPSSVSWHQSFLWQ